MTALSLAKLDSNISAKRRALATMIDDRTAAFEKVDAISEAIDAINAKGELTAEDEASLTAKLNDLKSARHDATAKGDAIRKAESELSDLVAERTARQEHNLQVANLNGSRGRETPHDDTSVVAGERFRTKDPFETATKEDLKADLGAYFQAAYLAKYNHCAIASVVRGDLGDQFKNDRLYAAVTTSTNTASMVPVNYANYLIELLTPMAVVRSLPGIRNIPLPNGNITIPRQSVAGSAAFTGEMVNIGVSDPQTDSIALSAKKLTTVTVSSGELLRRSSPSAMAMVRDDILGRTARHEDITFLRNTANLTTVPKGLKYFADQNSAAGVVTANTTVNLANVTADIGKLILKLRSRDVPFLNPVFIMSPRTERYLLDVRDGNGNWGFPEMQRGMLRQYPYRVTTQLPENLTVSATPNCAELYFIDASEILIGDTPTFELQVSTEAAYHDGSAVQASFSQDAAVFRLIKETDLQARHMASIAYMERITWA